MPYQHRILALAAVGALTLGACAGEDAASPGQTAPTIEPSDDGGPPSLDPGNADGTTTTPSPDATATTPAGSPADELNIGGNDGSAFCSLEPDLAHIEHVEFAYPDGWQIEPSSCEFFDPELETLPEDSEVPAAVTVRTTQSEFARVAEPGGETRDEIRYVGARSGYQAVRIRAEATGQGLRQQGEPVLTYLVDLDPGTDDEGGTLVLSAQRTEGASFDLAAEALDRMIGTLRVVPAAVEPGSAPIVVTRAEGRGAPFTVTLADGCLQLRPGGPRDAVADEACDLDPTDADIAASFLEAEDTRVVAGYSPARASFVLTDAASAPYGAFTAAIEGSTIFAYDVATSGDTDLRAVDVGGEVLARTTLER